MWYTLIGMLIVLVLGTIVSLMFKAISSLRSNTQLSVLEEMNDGAIGAVDLKNKSFTESVS